MQSISYIDHHAHIYGTGYKVLHPKLDTASSIDEVLNILKPQLQQSNVSWITARGWDQNKWAEKQFPTREHLNSLSSDIAIVLIRIDGHALWCNSKALALSGIDRNTPIPSGGDILKSASGEPTGIVLDDAMALVYDAMPIEDEVSITNTLRAGLTEFAKHHIGVHDMGIPAEWWESFKQLYKAKGDSLINSYVFLDMTKPTGKKLFLEKIKQEKFDDSTHPNLKLVGIKLYLDGALGSRGAHLFEPYSDDPGNTGLRLMDDTEALELMSLAASRGLQIAIHAIGDAANARALDLIAQTPNPKPQTQFRIEHAQIIRDEDLNRYKDLNVTAVIQPQFFASDRHWAIDRLGADRMKMAYRWRSLFDAGIKVAASSDSPVEDADAAIGIKLLQTRDGVNDGECVTKEIAEKWYQSCELD
ncbi:MAG TPA: amidohydrolase [Candidatus Kapabacteria bacterium]|nr:amidohydrolase [Candidatus Kapabacteria bacterium]